MLWAFWARIFSTKKNKENTVRFEKSFTRDLHTYTPLIYTEIYLVDLFLLLLQIPDLFSFLFSSNPSDLLLFYILLLLLLLLLCLPPWTFVSPPTTTHHHTPTNPEWILCQLFKFLSFSRFSGFEVMFRDRHSAVARSRRKAQKNFLFDLQLLLQTI